MPKRQAIPIFVVSLARAADRRAAMHAHLSGLGLAFEIIDAVDGRTLAPEQVDAIMPKGTPLSLGDLGCYLSHMSIYKRMVAEGIGLALILEDDASLNPMVAPLLRDNTIVDGFDICFLDSWFVGKEGRIYFDPDDRIQFDRTFTAHRVAPPPHGTHAYLITADLAARRAASALPVIEAIDWYSSLPVTTRYYSFLEPRGAWLNEEYSTVSFVSPHGKRNAQPWHMQWRRVTPWYDFWNIVHPSMIRARRDVARLTEQGILAPGRSWRPLPPTVPGGGPVRPRRAR